MSTDAFIWQIFVRQGLVAILTKRERTSLKFKLYYNNFSAVQGLYIHHYCILVQI